MTLGTLSKIVRVNTNAVSTYQTGTERKEIPLGASSFQNVKGINTHLIEDLGKFVYECDVDISLAILNNLGCLCHLDSGSKVGTSSNHRRVNLIDVLTNLRGRTRGYLLNVLYCVLFVTWVDTFR